MLSIKQGGIKDHFWVFGMTWAAIESRSPRHLANALTARPMDQLKVSVHTKKMVCCLFIQQRRSKVWGYNERWRREEWPPAGESDKMVRRLLNSFNKLKNETEREWKAQQSSEFPATKSTWNKKSDNRTYTQLNLWNGPEDSSKTTECKLFVLDRNTWWIELLMFYSNTWYPILYANEWLIINIDVRVKLQYLKPFKCVQIND